MPVSTTTYKESQSFTNIYEHSSDSYEILAFYYSQPTKIPSSLRQGDAVAHISTNSGCYFAWHFFFFPDLLIKRNPIHGYDDLLFCPSSCQALSPWTLIKGTAENEGSPGKGYALWQPCASKWMQRSSAVQEKACLSWTQCQKFHRSEWDHCLQSSNALTLAFPLSLLYG